MFSCLQMKKYDILMKVRNGGFSMIKCIVCDLDGTLMRPDDGIEESTYQLLRQCMDQGIEFVIATGRDINMVIDFMAKYNFDCDLILNNGAQYRNLSGSFNDIYPMDDKAFIDIANILHGYGYLLAIHTNQGKYSLHDTEDFWEYHMELLTKNLPEGMELPKKTFTTREGYLRDFKYKATPEQIIADGAKVLKIDARHKDVYSIEGVRSQLNIEGLEYSSSYADNIEITSSVSNKGILLRKVVEDKGYAMDEVATFGDGVNDCAMLEGFKYSFAPANACDKAKQIATYTLQKTNIEGAVGEGILLLKDMKLINM